MSSIYQFINTRHCYRRMCAHGYDRDHIALVVEHNRFKKQTASVGVNDFYIAISPGIYRHLHLCQLCRNISHWILLQWVRWHGCHDTNRYENIVLSTALAKARHGTDAELTNTAHHQYSDIVTASKVIANWTVCSTILRLTTQGMSITCGSVVRGIKWWSVDSPHKGPAMLKVFPCHASSMSCDLSLVSI